MIGTDVLSFKSSHSVHYTLKKVPLAAAPHIELYLASIKALPHLDSSKAKIIFFQKKIVDLSNEFVEMEKQIEIGLKEGFFHSVKISKIYHQFFYDAFHREIIDDFFCELRKVVSSGCVDSLKWVLNRFFTLQFENNSIELSKIDTTFDFDLESLMWVLDPENSRKTRRKICDDFFNYSLNSLNFLKEHLFFSLFMQGKKDYFFFPSVNFQEFFEQRQEGLIKKRYWMEDVLGKYPSSVRVNFRDSFVGFSKKKAHNSPGDCLFGVVHPVRFYSVKDIVQWLLDSRVDLNALINIFSFYCLDPTEYTKIFEALPTLNEKETDHLLKIFDKIGLIQPLDIPKEENILKPRSILANFLHKGEYGKIYEWIRHFFILTSLQSPFLAKHFVDYLKEEIFYSVFYNLPEDRLSIIEQDSLIKISVFEVILIKEGTKILEVLFDCKKYIGGFSFRIDEWIETIFSSNGSKLRFALFMNLENDSGKNKAAQRINQIQFYLHPLYLIGFAPDEKINNKFLKDLLLGFKKIEWIIPFFSNQHVFKFFLHLQELHLPFGLFHKRKMHAIEDVRKTILELLIEDKERFFQQFFRMLNQQIISTDQGMDYWNRIHLRQFLSICLQIVHTVDKQSGGDFKSEFKKPLKHLASNVIQGRKVQRILNNFLEIEYEDIGNRINLCRSTAYCFDFFAKQFRERFPDENNLGFSLIERKISNEILEYFPSISIYKIEWIFLLLKRTFMELIFEPSEYLLALFQIAKKHKDFLSFIIQDENGSDELTKIFGFHQILNWVLENFIKFKTAPFSFISSLSAKELLLVEWTSIKKWDPCIFDTVYFMKFYAEIFSVGKKALLFPGLEECSLTLDQSRKLEQKGKIFLFYEQIANPFFDALNKKEKIKLKGEQLVEFVHRLHLIAPYIDEAFRPFEEFAEFSSRDNIKQFKKKIFEKFTSLRGSGDILPEELIGKIIRLFKSLKRILNDLDPLEITDLKRVFQQIEFVELEDSFIEKGKIFAVSSTFLDDSSTPLTKEVLEKNFFYLIESIISRRSHVAVPEDLHEKQKYFDHLETKLFELKLHIERKIEQEKDLELIGPVLCNMASAALNCSTRWGLEIESAIDVLSASLTSKDYNAVLDRSLHAKRKQIIMSCLQEIYHEEVASFGIEFIIHHYNYIRSKYAEDLGLEPWSEWMILEEDALEIEVDLIDHDFFAKCERELKESLFPIAVCLSESPKMHDLFVQSLFSFYLDNCNAPAGSKDYLGIARYNIAAMEGKIYKFIDVLFEKYYSETKLEISGNSEKELLYLNCIIEQFHSHEMQEILEQKGVLSQFAFRMILENLKDKRIEGELLDGFNFYSENILDEKIEQIFSEYIGECVDPVHKALFVDLILNDGYVRSKLIEWDRKKSASAIIELEKTYWKSFLISLLRTLNQSMKGPRESQMIFSKWIGNDEIQSFILDAIVNREALKQINKIRKELFLLEKAREFTESCRALNFSSISDKQSIDFLKKLVGMPGSQLDKAIKDFVKRLEHDSLFIQFEEILDKRPTVKYLVLLEKLVKEGYLNTVDGKLSEKINLNYRLINS